MGTIGKQSITSSLITYVGFIVGAVNTWIFTANGYFTPDQYGLTRMIFELGFTLFALASMGSISILYRFYPYYRDRLPSRERDLFGKMTILGLAGFVAVSIALYFFHDLFIQKFAGNAALMVDYYYILFPFTLCLLLFSLLEAQAWNLRASIATVFCKELALRLLTSLLIGVLLLHWLNFDQFIWLFSMLYGMIALGLFVYLQRKHGLVFTLKTSYVTQKMAKKMVPYSFFITVVSFCSIFAKTFDTILIASVRDLSYVGIFSYATYLTAIMEAPQRGLIAASTPVIAQAWKDKDLPRISRIYKKSAINMLIFSGFMFALIALNFSNSILFLKQDPAYLKGQTAFLILGLTKVLETGTGLNSQIILTSRYWKVDFLSNVILLVVLIPLNYMLIKSMGIDGVALATFIAYMIFNVLRFVFIWVKFDMQPFTLATLWAVVVIVANFFIAKLIQVDSPLLEAVLQSIVFVVLSGVMIVKLKVSEDVNRGVDMVVARVKGLLKRG
ncbi:polysaccharide biosynthesis C-terminal domain-containing protein [Chitinophaga horti]|uniref:Polysaccharide biosynthesis C-terminal domain-containing protein n=1 Tax=Chitinophaga horti TaxID=2920382 RepID=A0ABY6J873_9BACT|nr:polysaccharide biosynthesis C-terminal domain-containing protein [Chitinophaga horti]UYQ95898.1 polysaccharide biosynthesis C-terminal domain-containing protein [Chitinophaga horti]